MKFKTSMLVAMVGACLSAQVASQPTGLFKTEWRLIDPPVKAESQKSVPSLRLEENRQLQGSDGCNRLSGRYSLDGERISFPQIGATRMACPQLQGSDAEFAARLTRIQTWRISGGVLELLADGAPLLRFQAGPAASRVAERDCAAATTQADINTCAHEDFLAATADYSAAYKAVADALAPARRDLFRRAQTAWIRYRTAICGFEASGAQGGSVQPMIKWQCDARLTRARTVELRALLDCKEGDLTCVRPK